MQKAEVILTRRFDRPPCHTDDAMKTELNGVPGKWRIYGIGSFQSVRQFHVEFRVVPKEMETLKATLERLETYYRSQISI